MAKYMKSRAITPPNACPVETIEFFFEYNNLYFHQKLNQKLSIFFHQNIHLFLYLFFHRNYLFPNL